MGGDTARPSESAEPARTAPGAKAWPLTNAKKRPPLAQLDPNVHPAAAAAGASSEEFFGIINVPSLALSKKKKYIYIYISIIYIYLTP